MKTASVPNGPDLDTIGTRVKHRHHSWMSPETPPASRHPGVDPMNLIIADERTLARAPNAALASGRDDPLVASKTAASSLDENIVGLPFADH